MANQDACKAFSKGGYWGSVVGAATVSLYQHPTVPAYWATLIIAVVLYVFMFWRVHQRIKQSQE